MSRSVVRVHAGPHLRSETEASVCEAHDGQTMIIGKFYWNRKSRGLCPTKPAMAKRAAGVVGGLAQLARAPALQAGGQRFESVILHQGDLSRKT